MECDICCHTAKDKHTFVCISCARSTLYPLRIDLATALLDREQAARRVRAIETGDISDLPPTITLDGAILDMRDCAKSHQVENKKSEAYFTEERIDQIDSKIRKLAEELKVMSKKLTSKKESRARFRSDEESARYGLKSRSVAETDSLQKALRQTRRKWDLDHSNMIQGRISLCRNAAKLGGLRRQKVVEGQSMREVFEIARGLPIFDLREINGADPEILTASLTQTAYLVSRVSTYLALRLPAQVVLPHKDHPHAILFSPTSSYLNRDSSGSPTQSSANSPSASHILNQRVATPRPLHVSRPLPKLYKEDPHAFSLFIEGVTLLAWNVAWLCQTQGMTGFERWTDISSMGRNLWQLLMADNRSALKAATDNRDKPPSTTTAKDDNNKTAKAAPSTLPTHFGFFSHGSANSFFGREGADLLNEWKLHTPTKVIDKVKSHLIQEMQGAEWEVLEDQEWAQAKAAMKADEEPVVVGGARRWSSSAKRDVAAAAGKGTSGWTRLRLRSDAQRSDALMGGKGAGAGAGDVIEE